MDSTQDSAISTSDEPAASTSQSQSDSQSPSDSPASNEPSTSKKIKNTPRSRKLKAPEGGNRGGPDEIFYVEKILKKRLTNKGEVQYFVKWRNYESKYNTWEPITSFHDPTIVESYEKRILKKTHKNGKIGRPKKTTAAESDEALETNSSEPSSRTNSSLSSHSATADPIELALNAACSSSSMAVPPTKTTRQPKPKSAAKPVKRNASPSEESDSSADSGAPSKVVKKSARKNDNQNQEPSTAAASAKQVASDPETPIKYVKEFTTISVDGVEIVFEELIPVM